MSNLKFDNLLLQQKDTISNILHPNHILDFIYSFTIIYHYPISLTHQPGKIIPIIQSILNEVGHQMIYNKLIA